MGSPSASNINPCFIQVKDFGLFKQRGRGEADNNKEEKRKLQDRIRELFPCHELVALIHQGKNILSKNLKKVLTTLVTFDTIITERR